jgi:hypothetical protein
MTRDLRLPAPTLSSESFSRFDNSQNVKISVAYFRLYSAAFFHRILFLEKKDWLPSRRVFRQDPEGGFFVRVDPVQGFHLRSDISPNNIGLLAPKSSAGGDAGILKGKTQRGDIGENVQPFLLSDEAGRRIEHRGLDFSHETIFC